jgi:hypothetical protein
MKYSHLCQTGDATADDLVEFIQQRVHQFYWEDDANCATAVLKILSEIFTVPLHQQLLDAAIGMHGAGGYRAQCGLVEGTLLFIGICGRRLEFSDAESIEHCRLFAEKFEHRFSTLLCRELRPEAFSEKNPPHLCEPLTIQALLFSIEFVTEVSSGKRAG